MRQRCDAAGLADSLHSFGERWFAPVDVPLGGFVEILVESLPQIGNVSLFEHEPREMRTPRHPAAQGFGFFETDIHTELPQPRRQPAIALAPRFLLIQHPVAE